MGMKLHAPLIAAVAAGVVLAGCSQPAARSPQGPTPSPAPTATARPATPAPSTRTLIAVFEDPGVLRLVTLDGQEVARTTTHGWTAAGVASDFVAFVDGSDLKALHADGSVTTLGHMPGTLAGRVVVSPDGRRWLWSTSTSTSSGTIVSSRVVLSAMGQSDRTVAQENTTVEPRVLRPYRWTPGGAVYENGAVGIGGYILFDASTGPTWRVPDGEGSPSPVGSATCHLADVAADGTSACFDPQVDGAPVLLRISSPEGGTATARLPRPAFTQYGAASFQPGNPARTLVVAGSPSVGGTQERYQTDLVDVATGAMRPFGPADMRPGDGAWTWLADGSLVEYRPVNTHGDPGVYVVAPDGSARKVVGSGTPVGAISA
jgi:hypothetical protein